MTPAIYYSCQRCTACCRWPGLVKVDAAEIAAIARHLGLSEHDFIQRYTRLRPQRDGLALIDKGQASASADYNHECIFLAGRDCAIQPVKPRQCAGFPNTWNFPGWREVCEAVPSLRAPAVAKCADQQSKAGMESVPPQAAENSMPAPTPLSPGR